MSKAAISEPSRSVGARPNQANSLGMSKTPLETDPRRAIQDETIRCLICGRTFGQLTNTHLRTHGTRAGEYKRRFGYNLSQAIMCRKLRRLYAERAVRAGLRRPERRAARLNSRQSSSNSQKVCQHSTQQPTDERQILRTSAAARNDCR